MSSTEEKYETLEKIGTFTLTSVDRSPPLGHFSNRNSPHSRFCSSIIFTVPILTWTLISQSSVNNFANELSSLC